MKTGREIERKFVVDRLPAGLLEPCAGQKVEQGYLLLNPERELRIRKIGSTHWMTVKTGQGLERGEDEVEIAPKLFEMLWPLTEGRRIKKTRYALQQGRHLFEIDLFGDHLSGLVLLEVEFASRAESQAFRIPGFAARDVTEDRSYKNSSLAICGLPEGHRKGRCHHE